MDNNNFPPLDPENSQPEVFPEIPERMELLDDLPVIEELTFEQESVAAPQQPEKTLQEPILEEIPFLEEPLPAEDPVIPEEQSAVPEIPEEESPVPEVQEEESPVPEVPEEESPVPEVQEELSLVPEVREEKRSDPEVPEAAEPAAAFPEPLTQLPIQQEDAGLSDLTASGEEVPETEMPPWPEPSQKLPAQAVEETPDQDYRDDSQDFEAMMNTPKPQPEKAEPSEPTIAPKGRPKRKKGEGLLGIPSILATFVWLALIVVIGVTAGRMLWICAADVLAFGREDKVVTVTVYEADTMEDIIEKLHAGGLIRYKSLFSLYANISDAEEDIKPGIYDLNTRYDYHALVNFMSPRSSREVIKVTIPEGYTCRQIFALLEENRICTAVDAASYAANGELPEYWFLEDLERGTENCLEGYLFPDTYEFYKNSTPREAIERMLDNFEYRFNEEMLAQLENLNEKVTDGSYGIREIVIIASLIEKESAAPGESPMVSGVIYNRLFRWGNNPPYLNIDASIVYAQEGNNARIDTSLESPYNTYLYEGLTPGPIANPGLASLKAALNPESHNYYYYVLNPSTGMHQFSTTYEEHQGYVREFADSTPEIEIE